MPFNLYDALAAGLWATTLMTGFLTLALALGYIHLDFARLLGGMVLRFDRRAAFVGLLMHFAAGLLFGLVYAWIFALIALRPVPWLMSLVGLGFGVYHWILSMPLISLGRWLNPHIRSGEEPDPGVWGIKFGPQEAAVRLLGHLIYGGTFGVAYATVAQLNGTASGQAIAGNGVSLLLAAILAGVVIYLYTSWLDTARIEHEYVFQAAAPSEGEARERSRQELRQRYERGEIDWETYQHLRREYASEP